MLNTLQNLTRLPQQLVDALQATTDTARQLPGLQRVVTERLGSMDRAVHDLLGLLSALAADLERVRATVEPQQERVAAIEQTVERLDLRLSALQGTLTVLKGDVEGATERLPDPNAPGPFARARDSLAGRS